MSINHNNANISTVPDHDPADLLKFATACTYNALKRLYNRHSSEHLRVILSFQKPEYLEDATQEYITSLLESGINLDQSVESIKTDAAETIAHVTANGKEINALQRAAHCVGDFIRKSTNGTHHTTKRINGKAVKIPLLAIDFSVENNTEYRDGLYYFSDMQTEDGIRAEHVERIKTAAKNPEQAETLLTVYNALQNGETQREISERLNVSAPMVYKHVSKIRDIFADDFAALDTLDSRNK